MLESPASLTNTFENSIEFFSSLGIAIDEINEIWEGYNSPDNSYHGELYDTKNRIFSIC